MYATELATLAAELSAPAVSRLADLDRCALQQATCPSCARIAELVHTAVLCARHHEPATAERLVDDAIAVLDDPAHRRHSVGSSDDPPAPEVFVRDLSMPVGPSGKPGFCTGPATL